MSNMKELNSVHFTVHFPDEEQSLQMVSNMPRELKGGLLTAKVDSPSFSAGNIGNKITGPIWSTAFSWRGLVRRGDQLFKNIVYLGGRVRELELSLNPIQREYRQQEENGSAPKKEF